MCRMLAVNFKVAEKQIKTLMKYLRFGLFSYINYYFIYLIRSIFWQKGLQRFLANAGRQKFTGSIWQVRRRHCRDKFLSSIHRYWCKKPHVIYSSED